mgnify:CR=1 FL=1
MVQASPLPSPSPVAQENIKYLITVTRSYKYLISMFTFEWPDEGFGNGLPVFPPSVSTVNLAGELLVLAKEQVPE